MNIMLFALLSILDQNRESKVDTISYWHVYYNKTKIYEFTDFGSREVILKLHKVNKDDSITIKYSRDTPCSSCPTFVTVEDEKHRPVLASKGKGTFNPVSFAVEELVEYYNKSGQKQFDVIYHEGAAGSGFARKILFRIKVE